MSQFLSAWTFDLFWLVNLILVAVAYGVGVRIVRPRAGWHRGASASFYGGLILLAATYLGPVSAWSHTFFWSHMGQHLVVMMAVAPMLVMGNPVTLAFLACSDDARRRWALPILRSRAAAIVTNRYVTWVLFAGVLLGFHFSPFYDYALRNHDVDYFIEQPIYLFAAFLFYLPLIGHNLQPRRPTHAQRLGSLALMMVPEALVGAVIYFASVPLYGTFDKPRPFGPGVMDDQRLAGALMWALVMVVDSGWMMLAAYEWFSDEERKGRRDDAQLAREQQVVR